MPELPPDLSRLGDTLEHAIGRAIARRRAQLRAAWTLGAVVAALPLALGAANLYVRNTDGQVPAGVPQVTSTAQPVSGTEPPESLHPGPERGDRVMPAIAAGRTGRSADSASHPLDSIPPPASARSARNYDGGVATERVDRRPPFAPRLI